jgi:hypothetical protein
MKSLAMCSRLTPSRTPQIEVLHADEQMVEHPLDQVQALVVHHTADGKRVRLRSGKAMSQTTEAPLP